MWIAVIIVVTIIGAVIGYYIANVGDDNELWGILIGGALFFAICMGVKLGVTDKSFICTDVSFDEYKTMDANKQKELYKTKVEALGSKMILDFYDNSVKCTSIYEHKGKEATHSFVLDKTVDGYTSTARHKNIEKYIYKSNSVTMELGEDGNPLVIFSFSIKDGNGLTFTFKREFFK